MTQFRDGQKKWNSGCSRQWHQVASETEIATKEIGSRLAQAVGDNSLAELDSSLQGLRVASFRSTLMQTTLVWEYFFWQLGRVLFGMPARGPSRPLNRMVGSRVAAFHHCTISHWPTVPGGRWSAGLPTGPALAVGKLSLFWVASPGDVSEPLLWSVLGSSPFGSSLPAWDCLFPLKVQRSNSEIDLCSNRFELCDVRNTSAHRKRLTTGEDVSGRELVGQILQVKILGDLSARRQCAKQAQGSQCLTEHATQRQAIRNVKTHDGWQVIQSKTVEDTSGRGLLHSLAPEERKSDQPTLLSNCEAELEEVSGHEREKQTTTQLLIPSPLQTNEGRLWSRAPVERVCQESWRGSKQSANVESFTFWPKEDCKSEDRYYLHWLINQTLLHRHLQQQIVTFPTRRQRSPSCLTMSRSHQKRQE